jgi:hypothetical protein
MFKSTRKWNINRHIRTVHLGNATALNLKSGKLSKSFTPSLAPVNKGLLSFIYNPSFSENDPEFAEIESELTIFMDKETKTLMSIYEELSKQISALEQFSPNEINKVQISAFLMYSLLTENPNHTLDETIRLMQLKHAKQKVISYASKFFNGDASVTDTIVSSLIKITLYYKNKLSFQSI